MQEKTKSNQVQTWSQDTINKVLCDISSKESKLFSFTIPDDLLSKNNSQFICKLYSNKSVDDSNSRCASQYFSSGPSSSITIHCNKYIKVLKSFDVSREELIAYRQEFADWRSDAKNGTVSPTPIAWYSLIKEKVKHKVFYIYKELETVFLSNKETSIYNNEEVITLSGFAKNELNASGELLSLKHLSNAINILVDNNFINTENVFVIINYHDIKNIRQLVEVGCSNLIVTEFGETPIILSSNLPEGKVFVTSTDAVKLVFFKEPILTIKRDNLGGATLQIEILATIIANGYGIVEINNIGR